MKKIKLFLVLSLFGLFLFSCSKQQEETKMIPTTAVKMSGKHSELLKIDADSVKVMLVKIDEDRWTLRALIPIKNTYDWDVVSHKYKHPDPDKEYYPSMGSEDWTNKRFEVEFLDANGSPINFEVEPDWDIVKSVLSSNSIKKEDMLVKEDRGFHADEYKIIKEKFDKIAGIALKGLELSYSYKHDGSSYSSSDSNNSSDDDWDDVDLDDAVNAAKAATEMLKATGEVVKSTKDVYKEAKKTEKQLKKMEKDDDDWGW
jgi:hypothetical protein